MAITLGTENKKKLYSAIALGVVVVGFAAWRLWDIFGPEPAPASPPPAAAAPAHPAARPAGQTASSSGDHEAAKVFHIGNPLDPTLHPELMAQAETLEYTGNGRNIFSQSSVPTVAIPTAIRPARPKPVEVAQTGPPPPPPPPNIDLKFFGFSAQKAGARRAFLLHGDDVFIAGEGDIVDHRYRVVKIAPTSVQVEDIPYHNTQNLPLQQ